MYLILSELKEIAYHCPGVLWLLLGNKVDLLEDKNTIDRLRSQQVVPVQYEQVNFVEFH
jgi:GTPase SAR1 family protein